MVLTLAMSAGVSQAREFAQSSDTTMLEGIDVMAVKSQQKLWKSPVAATIATRADLERLDAMSLKGISDVVPNFYIPDYGSRITSSIYVRGIGARMDQPSVGFIVDNVAILNKDAYDFDVDDIAEAEVLRGPQSTLYGRNTMGGLINITTLSPMRYQGWRFNAEAASGLRFRVGAGWYGKLRDDMGLSATAAFSARRGFFKNQYNGRYADKERSGNARIKYIWNATPMLTLQNTLSASLLRQGGYPYEYMATGEIAYNDTCFYRRFTISDGLSARYRFEPFTLTAVASVQHIDDNMTLDQDFLPLSYFTLTQRKKETGITLDVTARDTRDADNVYHWLGGLFGFWKQLDMSSPVTFKDVGIAELIEKHRNDANPYYPIAWDTRSFPLNSDFRMPNFGLAIYHESKINLGSWHISAGVRLDYEQTRMRYHSHCDTGYTIYYTENPSVAPAGGDVFRHDPIKIDETGRLRRHYFNVMPKLGVVLDLPFNESNLYASITRGFKSGGFNTQMFSDVLQQKLMKMMGIGMQYDVDDIVGYKPEKSWNYELGAHLDLIPGRMGADMAMFFIDCTDQQLTMFPDGTTTGRIMTNAGSTHSWGGEVSVWGEPIRDLRLNASYGYTHARFRRFHDGRADYRGKALPYVPENTLFLQAIYHLRLNLGIFEFLEFDANMRGTGRIYWNESNTLNQPFYALAGASVTAQIGKVSVQIWGRNITGTRYHTFYFLSMGNEFLQRGIPANGGVTLRFSI